MLKYYKENEQEINEFNKNLNTYDHNFFMLEHSILKEDSFLNGITTIYNNRHLLKNIRYQYNRFYKKFDDGTITLINSIYKPTKNKNYFLNIYYCDDVGQHIFEYDYISQYKYAKKYTIHKHICRTKFQHFYNDTKILIKTYFTETEKDIINILFNVKLLLY